MILLLSMGCTGEAQIVQIMGVITNGRDGTEGASGVEVMALNPSYEETGTATTDGRGWMAVDAVAGAPVFLTLQAEGIATVGFSGTVGTTDLEFEDGLIWVRTVEAQETLDGEFGGCEHATDGAALVEGEMRHSLAGYEMDDGGEWPIAHEGYVAVVDGDGGVWEACYLNDDGFLDAEATLTGATGRFAVYGDFSGPIRLVAGYELGGEPYWETEYLIHVPEGGVAPLYPVYVALPE